MNIYQLARERSAKFDERALAKPAEVALTAKKTRDRKWREANHDKVEAMRLKDRERDKTPERKAMHKAWAQSPAGKESERRLTFKNPRIRIGTGKPEWGAETGKKYFVITWEED